MSDTVKRALASLAPAPRARPVGRVSPKGVTRQVPDGGAAGGAENVGLRCANPTYEAAAGYVQAVREMWDGPDEVVLGGGV